MEHVKNAYQNITTEQTPQSVSKDSFIKYNGAIIVHGYQDPRAQDGGAQPGRIRRLLCLPPDSTLHHPIMLQALQFLL